MIVYPVTLTVSILLKTDYNGNKIHVYREKKFLWLLCGVQHSVIMADFIMPETQQLTIVIIFIIYSPYLLRTF